MHPQRKKRLILILLMLVGVAVATTAIIQALNDNLNHFYPPRDVASGVAPEDATIRMGGIVKPGSIVRSDETLLVHFVITDNTADVKVVYSGILPDLFEEGEAAVATGSYTEGLFTASQVLAKHDENYMPPEVEEMMSEQNEAANYGS